MNKPVVHIANPSDHVFHNKVFLVHLHEFDMLGILVFAEYESAALDSAADYAEKQGWDGVFTKQDEIKPEDEEQYSYCGNHCLPIRNECIHIFEVTEPDRRAAAQLLGFLVENKIGLMHDQACSILWPREDFQVDDAKTKALKVIVLDRRISAWLSENDPQALKQCKKALGVN